MSESGGTTQDEEAPGDDNDEQGEDHGGGLGSGGGKMLLVGYVAIIALVVVALLLLLGLGKGLKPPQQQGGGARDPRSKINADKVMWHILLTGAVILVTARAFGRLAHRFRQPHVIGQIVGCILLGPSLLGEIWPSAFEFLFPSELSTYVDMLAQMALIFYMFIVGIELDFGLLRDRGAAATRMTSVSVVAPLLMGVALAPWFHPRYAGDESFAPFALFLGVAMAATGFPVLARILTDRGLFKTGLGRLALRVGALTDVVTWSMLALVIIVARSSGVGSVARIAVLMLFIAFMIYAVRPVLHRVSSYYEQRGALGGTFLAALFVGLLLSALVTDKLRMHVIFGAFLFGVIMPHGSKFVGELTEKMEDFSVVFLLPFFFTFSGLRTDISAIGGSAGRWLMTLVILAVAIAAKWGGSALAASYAGLDRKEAGALGVLVNCRGLTELIILNIGLQLGILSPAIFAMLVIMAVVTTVMTEPTLARYYPRAVQRRMIKEEAGGDGEGDEDDEDRWKIVVAVGRAEVSEELTHVATLVAGDQEEEAEVTLVRVVDVSGTEVSHAAAVQDSTLQEAADRLRPLREVVEEAGFEAHPVAIAGGHVGDTISRVANELDADLVLMGYHRALFGHHLLGGKVGQVLREAQSDVAVLVDPEGPRQFSLGEGARILVPYGGQFHEEAGLDLALRLARATGAGLTLLAPGGEEAEEQAAEVREGSGVDFELVAVDGDITEALFERAGDFDLLVLGVSDRWMSDNQTLASVREEVMEKAGTPYLLVRRRGGARGHLRRWWARAKRAPKVVAAVYRSEGDDVADAPRRAGEETRERMDDPDGQSSSGDEDEDEDE